MLHHLSNPARDDVAQPVGSAWIVRYWFETKLRVLGTAAPMRHD
jgi:hypothetical protein